MSATAQNDAVVLYRLEATQQHFLLISRTKRSALGVFNSRRYMVDSREDVVLVRFDSLSGALQYTQTPGLDIFPNKVGH